MKTEVKKFRDAIESIYDSPGYFTDKQRTKMKKLKKEREKIYQELAKVNSEVFSDITFTIETGFFNIWDDKKSMQYHQKLFRQAKSNLRKKIDASIGKINKQLAEKDPYFETFPISVVAKIMPHKLDYPPKKSSFRRNRSILIKNLSNSLKSHFPRKADRQKFLSNILQYIYGIPKSETQPSQIRRHL